MLVTLPLQSSTQDPSKRRLISDLSLAVAKSKRIVVVTGAGISCSCGIPDFRSSDGLYNLVKQQYPDVVLKGRDLFDASLFRDATSTAVFYTFISKLKESVDSVSPSPTHRFIKTLDTKGKLLRSYTQNIDGLEEEVGLLGSSSTEAKNSGKGKGKIRLKEVKNVQLHGDIRRVRCTFCSADFPFAPPHAHAFKSGSAPDCPECLSRSEARVARSARPLKIGTLRPGIVLYDEPHPLGDDIGLIESADLARKPDLLIIMGTSLKVHGLKKLVKEFAKAVHTLGSSSQKPSAGGQLARKVIFVNKTPPSSEWDGVIDYHIEGETDAWVERVLEDWKRLRPADWEIQTKLVADGEPHNGPFKVSKSVCATGKSAKGGKRKGTKSVLELENIPPIRSSPSADKSIVSIVMASPSPGKRCQVGSHYSNVDCSPSKKRISQKTDRSEIAADERGLLFSNSKSVNVVVDMSVDIDPKETNALRALYDAQQTSNSKPTKPRRLPPGRRKKVNSVIPTPDTDGVFLA